MQTFKEGDLVVVYKPCPYCGSDAGVGTMFKIFEFFPALILSCCGILKNSEPAAAINADYGYILPVLKKIPPLSELEDEKNKEELTA